MRASHQVKALAAATPYGENTMPAIETTPATQILLDALNFGFSSFETHRPTTFDMFAVSAADIKRLMRASGKTIDELARESTITQARIREWRRDGLRGFNAIEAIYWITGVWIR